MDVRKTSRDRYKRQQDKRGQENREGEEVWKKQMLEEMERRYLKSACAWLCILPETEIALTPLRTASNFFSLLETLNSNRKSREKKQFSQHVNN